LRFTLRSPFAQRRAFFFFAFGAARFPGPA
jgi:hypothetical protein